MSGVSAPATDEPGLLARRGEGAREPKGRHQAPTGARFAFVVAFVVLAAIRHWETVPDGAFEGIAVVTVAGGLVLAVRDGHRLSLLRTFLTLSLAFSLVSLLSIIQSAEPDAALKAWGRLALAQSLGLGCYLLTSDRRRLWRFTLGGIAGIGLIAAGSLGLLPVDWLPLDKIDEGDRLSGPVGDPNFFGQFLVVGLALAVATVRSERRITAVRLFAVAVAALALAAAVGTESRGTLVAMVAVGVTNFVRAPRSTRVALVALIVVVIALAPADAVSDNAERLVRVPSSLNDALLTQSAEDTAVGGRLSEAIAAVEMLRDHPLLGVGVGTYRYRYLDYAVDIGIDVRGEERDSHSRHLEVAAETGVLGVLVWMALLLACAFLCVSSVRRRTGDPRLDTTAAAWATAFLGWVITAVFLHDYQPEIEWLVIGAVFGTAEAVRSHPRGQPAPRPVSSS